MKLANTSETVRFGITMVLGTDMDVRPNLQVKAVQDGKINKEATPEEQEKQLNEVVKEYQATCQSYLKPVSGDAAAVAEAKETAKAKLRTFFNEQYLKALENFGCETTLDAISLSMNPGSVLFDLYTSNLKEPTAPLAKALQARKVQELAHSLAKAETIEPSQEVLDSAKRVLEDEKLWESVNLTASFKVGDDTRYMLLSSKAANYYAKTLNAVLNLYGLGEAPKEEAAKPELSEATKAAVAELKAAQEEKAPSEGQPA